MPGSYTKIATALPVSRVILLLLGDRPTPFVASTILRFIAICLAGSGSFSRKFELVSGWSVLRMILPKSWDPSVHEWAFNILLGRSPSHTPNEKPASTVVSCPQITAVILSALRRGLENVIALMDGASTPRSLDGMFATFSRVPAKLNSTSGATEAMTEALIESLIELHSSSTTFRQIFKSQQTTQIFVDAYKLFVTSVESSNRVKPQVVRILEKLTHLALSLALDPDVSGSHKREVGYAHPLPLSIAQSRRS